MLEGVVSDVIYAPQESQVTRICHPDFYYLRRYLTRLDAVGLFYLILGFYNPIQTGPKRHKLTTYMFIDMVEVISCKM